MRKTTLLEKALPSFINLVITLLLSTPLLWLPLGLTAKKILIIGIFFGYNLFFLFFNKNRCLGMVIAATDWDKDYSFKNKLVFLFLYTLSFSTLFFWVYFPFDLFLANMLLLQLPMILVKKTTMHGFLSGQMTTVRIPRHNK